MKSPDYTNNQELIKAYLEADSPETANVYANAIVAANTMLVYSAIKQWFPTYYAASFYEDIVQAGLFGIFDAIRHYNLEEKTVFSTFAMHYIKGAIKQTIMEETNKTSYHFSRLGRIIKDAQTKLKNSGIAHPTRDQIAAETGLSYLVINNAIAANNIGDTLHIDDVAEYLSSGENVEHDVEQRELRVALLKAINHLPREHRLIIEYSFGLATGKTYTDPQIARILHEMGIEIEAAKIKAMKQSALKTLSKNPELLRVVKDNSDQKKEQNPFLANGPFAVMDNELFARQIKMLDDLDDEGVDFDFTKEFISCCKKSSAV